MTGMTTDYAIAILRRMQEPDPYEPQINESAFDALEMAIQAIQKYSTWSQTYSNMVEDTIFRKDALDAIHRYFGKRIEQSPMHKTVDGEVYDLGICNPLLADNKALSRAIKELPSCSKMEQVEDCISRQAAIEVIDAVFPVDPMKSEYAQGIACGAALAKTYVERLPSAQPDHIGDVTEMVGNTISRQDVIDSIVAWTVEDRPDIEMPTDLVGRIESLPSAQPEQQWIPCSERLPRGSCSDLVIVSCHDDSGDTPLDYTSCGWVTTDGEYWIVDNEINNYVVAWMPLPEPYKEKDNEKVSDRLPI